MKSLLLSWSLQFLTIKSSYKGPLIRTFITLFCILFTWLWIDVSFNSMFFSAGSAYDCELPGVVGNEADCQKFWLCKETPEGSRVLEVNKIQFKDFSSNIWTNIQQNVEHLLCSIFSCQHFSNFLLLSNSHEKLQICENFNFGRFSFFSGFCNRSISSKFTKVTLLCIKKYTVFNWLIVLRHVNMTFNILII